MSTKKQIVDRVMTTLRQNSKDRGMSKRYILHILEEKMKFLISQKMRERSLYRDESLYNTIECYEFEEIDTINCDIIEFRSCDSIMKGKIKLPELIYSKYGDSIKMITNLDNSLKIESSSLSEYMRNKHRKGYEKEPLFYIRDGYPYLINTKMEVGAVTLITMETQKTYCTENTCKPILEYTFTGTDKLNEIVVQQTLQEILGSYMQVQPDENQNKNENII